MDQCEYPLSGLDFTAADDLGLTLSPGLKQLLPRLVLKNGQLANPFDPSLECNGDLDIDFSSLDNVDWALDGFKVEKKRTGDDAFPDEPSPAASKKHHVEAQQVPTSSPLLDAYKPKSPLLCQPLSFDDDLFDDIDTTSVASAAQNMPSVITFAKVPKGRAVKTSMSVNDHPGNNANNQASLSSNLGSSRVQYSPVSKQRAKRKTSADLDAIKKASVSAHMGPIHISPGKQLVKKNLPAGVETANKSSISAHAGSFRVQPSRASGVAKQKFQVQQQDLMTNSTRETLTRVDPRLACTPGYTKAGYVPSAPNQHARVVQFGSDVANTQLLQAKHQIAALIAERNKFKEFYDTYGAVDPERGIPKFRVLEKERATLRRLCTTQKRLNLQTKSESKEWEAKFLHLAGTFNQLLNDYQTLLRAVTANSDNFIQVPLPTAAHSAAPVGLTATSAKSAQPQETSLTHVPQLAMSVRNTAAARLTQRVRDPINAVRFNRAQQLAACASPAAARSIPNHAATSPVTPPTISQEPAIQVLPAVEREAEPQSAAVIDLTSEKSLVSNPAIDGPQSLQSIGTPQEDTIVNALAEFHRAVRTKDFEWLRQHDADIVEASKLTKSKDPTHSDSPKDEIAPDIKGNEMTPKEARDLVQSQKVIRHSLDFPFKPTGDDEHQSETNDASSNIIPTTSHADADHDSLFGGDSPPDFANFADAPDETPDIPADAPATTTPPLPTVGPDGHYHVTDEELTRMLEEEMMRD